MFIFFTDGVAVCKIGFFILCTILGDKYRRVLRFKVRRQEFIQDGVDILARALSN